MHSFIQRELVETLFSGQGSPMLGLNKRRLRVAEEWPFHAIINSCGHNAAESAEYCSPKPDFRNSGNDEWGAQVSLSHIIVVISVCAVLVDCCPYH